MEETQGSIVLADGVLQFSGKMCQTGRQSGQDTVHRNSVIYLSSLPYLSYRFTVLVTNVVRAESLAETSLHSNVQWMTPGLGACIWRTCQAAISWTQLLPSATTGCCFVTHQNSFCHLSATTQCH